MIDLLVSALMAAGTSGLDHGHNHSHDAHVDRTVSTVAADVRTVDVEARTALLRHEAMTELGMPSMVMQFSIADDVDIDLFEPGAALTITATNGEDGLQVIAAEIEHGHHE